MQPVFRRIYENPEVRLTLKTLPRMKDELARLFAQAHPYDLPQFLCATQEASAAYADWVRGEVA